MQNEESQPCSDSGLPRRCWINQPSTHHPLHHLHGTNVLAVPESFEGSSRIYLLSGEVVSMSVPNLSLSEGWRPEPEPAGKCVIEVVEGVGGPSLYVGDESISHRLAGPKPWGGGRTVFKFEVAIAELVREAGALADRGEEE